MSEVGLAILYQLLITVDKFMYKSIMFSVYKFTIIIWHLNIIFATYTWPLSLGGVIG